jgi:ABC-2 type transport system ATP-binding protein
MLQYTLAKGARAAWTNMKRRVIELANLSKTYGRGGSGVAAVRDVSLSVGPGEVYGFLGPNGAGKSTTIRMLLGLISPSAGEARLFGEDLSRNPSVLKRVGSLVDGGAFYPFLSGRQNLDVLARTHGGRGERIDALLEQVGLAADGTRKVKGYSTGMRQRLGVAAALLGDPDLVILDEPVNGLDAAGIQEMRALIRSLAADRGKTVFLSSHLLHEVQQVCDRIAIISKGEVVRQSTIADLLRQDDGLRIEAPRSRSPRRPCPRAGRWSEAATPCSSAPPAPRRRRWCGAWSAPGELFQPSRAAQLEDVFLSITQPEARCLSAFRRMLKPPTRRRGFWSGSIRSASSSSSR